MAFDEQPQLTDEDITTDTSGAPEPSVQASNPIAATADPARDDADGTDGDDADGEDSDGTDGDATDGTDGDATDADGQDA